MDRQIRDISSRNARRRLFKRCIAMLCVVVMLFTIETLKRDASTMQSPNTRCGLEEHTHVEACWDGGTLVCGMVEHVHTDNCFLPPKEVPTEQEIATVASGAVETLAVARGDMNNEFTVVSGVKDTAQEITFDLSYDGEESANEASVDVLDEMLAPVPEVEPIQEAAPVLEDESIQKIEPVQETELAPVVLPNWKAGTSTEADAPAEADGVEVPVESEPVEEEIEETMDEPVPFVAEEVIGVEEAGEITEEETEVEKPEEETESGNTEEETEAEKSEEETEVENTEEQPEEETADENTEEQTEGEEPEAEAEEPATGIAALTLEGVAHYAADIDLTGAELPLYLRALMAQAQLVEVEQTEAPAEEAAPAEGSDEEAAEPEVNVVAAQQTEDLSKWIIEYDGALITMEALDDDWSVVPAVSFDETQIRVYNGALYTLTLRGAVVEEPEEEKIDGNAPQILEGVARYAADIDLSEAQLPLYLRALMAQAQLVEVEQPETSVEGDDAEAVESGAEPEVNVVPAEETENLADWIIECDGTLITLDPLEDDWAIRPVVSFGEAQIVVYNGALYTLTLRNAVVLPRPAQTFEAETATMRVSVTAPEGAFPEGTTMAVTDVEDEETLGSIAESAAEESREVRSVHVVDITFYYQEEKVEPLIPISVAMSVLERPAVKENQEDPDIVVMHVDDEGAMEVVPEAETIENETVFEADRFSMYALIEMGLVGYVTLPGSDGIYEVTVTYGPDAKFPEDAQLSVTAFAEDSGEYAAAKEAVVAAKKAEDENFDETSLGFAALDISVLDAQGNKVEPAEGAEIKVFIRMLELPEGASEASLAQTMEVQHLNERAGEVVVETVAGVEDVAVAEGTAETKFTLDSFSTFALTWGEDEKATVHFGTMDGTEFVEFDDETIVFDTTAASINIANKFAGYTYRDAVYCENEETPIENGVDMSSILDKDDATGKWKAKTYTTDANDQTVENTILVANGSHMYVTYFKPQEGNPSGAGDDTIPSPTTTKTVTDNHDGTYTIQLDVKGATVTEDNSHYANVLVILDATRSMNGAKWTNAKAAMNTLIETLTEGENSKNAGKIDFALVTFGRSATVTQNWTKDNAAFKTTCAGINMVTTSGTNWEAGMRGGLYGVLNNLPDDDPTYVIFLTDGDPNVYYSSGADTNYTNTGTTSGYSQNANTSATHSADEAKAIAAKTKLYGIYCGASGTNPSGESYNRLVSVITGQGQGGVKTISANADTIGNEFKLIAQTVLDSIGASNVSVDDGVPSLSSISARTVGTAGGFEYYISTAEEPEFKEWDDAPGASYSNDNGVTWDLSKVGVLPDDSTYRLKFTVWPSQEALDIIADLNNGTKTIDQLDEAIAAQISGDETAGYWLDTNTHLNTTYTFKGETYTDTVDPVPSEDMPMKSELMTVKKAFAHNINEQDPYKSIVFYLLRDGKYYQKDGTVSETLDESKVKELPVNTDNNWTNSIFIAPGFMKDGEILETGHKYSLEEKILVGNEYEYEFTPQTVRPMKISEDLTYLVLVDKYNPAPSGATKYYIDDAAGTYREATDADTENVYYVATGNSAALIGTNRKTAELDITKRIVDNTGNFTEAQLDAETFTYRVTLTVPEGSDISGITAYEYVPRTGEGRFTIFGYQSDDPETSQAISSDVTKFSGDTFGYYTVTTQGGGNTLEHVFTANPDGTMSATIDITLKRNEIIRFTNLPADTEYTIVEMYNNYRQADPSRNADAAGSDEPANIADQGYTTTIATKSRNPVTDTVRTGSESGTTVSGTIDYLDVRYYNQFTNTLNDAIDVELTGTKHLEGYEWSGESYYFNLEAADGAPLPIAGAYGRTRFYLKETSGSADKTYSFGKIRFTEAGTYTYTIKEDDAGSLKPVNGKAVQFGAAETITIEIAENDGKLSVESVTNDSGNTTWDKDNLIANTTITNTAPTTEVNATKEWQNADGTTTAPENAKVTFTLYADGDSTDQTVELDGTPDETGEATAWVATFSGLQQYKIVEGQDDPVAITYTIGETVTWPGYDLITTDPVASGGTIINRRQTGDLKITKAIDPEDIEGANTKFFQVSVKNGDGKYVKTKEVPVQGTGDETEATTEIHFDGFSDDEVLLNVSVDSPLIIKGLPTDTYTVEENTEETAVAIEGYRWDDVTYSAGEKTDGTVEVKKQDDPATMIITNSYTELTSAQVIKDLVDPTSTEAQVFTFYAKLEEGDKDITGILGDIVESGENKGWHMFTISATHTVDGVQEFSDLPVGAKLTVKEALPDGMVYTVTPDALQTVDSLDALNTEGEEPTIPDTNKLTFTNTRQTGTLELTKTVAGATAPDGKKYLVSVKNSDNQYLTGLGTETSPIAFGAEETWLEIPVGTTTISNLPTDTYTVTEKTAAVGDDDTDPVAIEDYNWISVTYAPATIDSTESGTVEVTQDNPATMAITNTYERAIQYVRVYKYDATDMTKSLSGAEFSLTGPEDTQIAYSGCITNGDGYLVFDEKEGTLIIALPVSDQPYTLTETNPPAGYNKHETITFTVGTNTVDAGKYTREETETVGDYQNVFTIEVPNTAGVELPMTGGPGTVAYTVSGIALLLAAAWLALSKLRQGKRDFE